MSLSTSTVVDALRGRRVAVLGDVMLDEHIRGDVTRISPEAPVPILEVRGQTYAAGGAANTGANMRALGGQVTLVGVIGADAHGAKLREALAALSVDASGLIEDPSRPTTTKTRIIARNQQVVRLDREVREALASEIEGRVAAQIEALSGQVEAWVISDYGKGVVSAPLAKLVIDAARRHSVPVVVDPKCRDFSRYAGATVVTPNRDELERATDLPVATDAEVVRAAESLFPRFGDGAILVTRGAEGMTLVQRGRAPLFIPTTAKLVYDVTGAGDTVVSVMALGLAGRLELAELVSIANIAAGIVVSKPGTATLGLHELAASIEAAHLP